MKKYLHLILLSIVIINFIGCSEEPPSVRVYNLHSEKANVQFKQSNGNTINHNGVAPETYSNYQDISEGACVATAVIQNDESTPTVSFNATNDNNYTIVIIENDSTMLRVDKKSK